MSKPARPDDWLRTRNVLNTHRHELTEQASQLYRDSKRVLGTSLLTKDRWLPSPVHLDELSLQWVPDAPRPAIDGTGLVTAHARSMDQDGQLFDTYADTLGTLARPMVFENRPVYRLVSADLASNRPRLQFAPGSYFDGINVGEAAAHELAASWPDKGPPPLAGLPIRMAVGDPVDLTHRPATLAVSTLTIRYDRARGEASFVAHWRDPAKVAHAGGMLQVVPVGIFQPTDDSAENLHGDFSLWKGMVREFSEELLGEQEVRPAAHTAMDYEEWPFFRDITDAKDDGRVQVFALGLGVDPLSWATDLLTVAVFDSATFDLLFSRLVSENAEGRLRRLPFDDATVGTLLAGVKPIQAAGAATLALAQRFWSDLLPHDT